RESLEGLDVVAAERAAAAIDRLDDAQQAALEQDRHGQDRARDEAALLVHPGGPARIGARVVDDLGLAGLGDGPGDALAQLEADLGELIAEAEGDVEVKLLRRLVEEQE